MQSEDIMRMNRVYYAKKMERRERRSHLNVATKEQRANRICFLFFSNCHRST